MERSLSQQYPAIQLELLFSQVALHLHSLFSHLGTTLFAQAGQSASLKHSTTSTEQLPENNQPPKRI